MKHILVVIAFFSLLACQSKVAIEDIDTVPVIEKNDEKFADVFQHLEGQWEGQLKIFEDLSPSKREKKALQQLDMSDLRNPNLKLQQIANVQRNYRSESPYFQRIEIQETYYDEEGKELEQLIYTGVNKVQKGNLWSVLQGRGDTLQLRAGKIMNDKLISWKRNEKAPYRMDYIEEKRQENILELIGYTYGPEDNPKLMPRFWYYGRYELVK